MTVKIYSVHDSTFGKNWEEWVKLWWEWCYSEPEGSNAVLDNTGEFCGRKQIHESVWFLAGTFGGEAVRRCHLPRNRAIFFPIITNLVSFATDSQLSTDIELVKYASEDIDGVKVLYLRIDDMKILNLKDYRVRTRPFEIRLPKGSLVREEVLTKAVSDGYWCFLEPFSRGKHEIEFIGEKIAFDEYVASENKITKPFRVQVTYQTTVD